MGSQMLVGDNFVFQQKEVYIIRNDSFNLLFQDFVVVHFFHKRHEVIFLF